MPGPIDVAITVDVEFNLNDALTRTDRAPIGDPWVLGELDGRSQGLGFLLDTLDRYGLKGTFFTELFNVFHFGDGPIQGIIERMLDRGQDVQMHLHQVWLYYHDPVLRAQLPSRPQPDDQFYGWEVAVLRPWLELGMDIYKRLTGRSPVALRTGALTADSNLYTAMDQVGLRLSSNLGVAMMPAREARLQLFSGVHALSGVTEVPATSYADALSRQPRRLLTTAGSSFTELRSVLDRAARRGVGPIVILVHPHDFLTRIRKLGGDRFSFRPDRLRQSRFVRLCEYLSGHPERFRVVTFEQARERWQGQTQRANVLLNASASGFIARAAENVLLPKVQRLLQRSEA